MLFTFTVDPMAGTGVAVGPANVGLALGDGLLLFVDEQPASATAAKKIQTSITIDDLHFKRFPPIERIPALEPVTFRLIYTILYVLS